MSHQATGENILSLTGDITNHTFADKTIGMEGGGNASLCESILQHYLSPQDTDMCSPRPCSIGQVRVESGPCRHPD